MQKKDPASFSRPPAFDFTQACYLLSGIALLIFAPLRTKVCALIKALSGTDSCAFLAQAWNQPSEGACLPMAVL